MGYDVTIDRDIYIGGSDIPCIMGISPFKTRYQLLLEKAGLAENDFQGNKYTVYGQRLEGDIRAFINDLYGTTFEPNRVVVGDFRAHTDGFNGEAVLEVKTTSRIYETVDEYKVYLVQLLKYMEVNKVEKGILAVYERPADFDTDFDPLRLRIYEIDIQGYKSLLEDINAAIELFRADLGRLRENPLLCEQDFQPTELVTLSNKVIAFENRLAEFKSLEKEYKDAKTALYKAMREHGVKSWQTPNGTRITAVAGTPASTKTVTEFDLETFKTENAELYAKYMKDVEKKTAAKSGYVKITIGAK